MMESKNKSVGVLAIRLILGLIFFLQGFGKVFSWGVDNVYKADFFLGTYEDVLPNFIIVCTAYYTSYVELIGGLLLILGLKTNIALYALASVLVIVTFGHGLVEPIWDLSHVMYRLILLSALLFMPKEWDKFSVDHLINNYKKSNKIISS